jgi:CRISPR-associated protein (TIGR03984 family)
MHPVDPFGCEVKEVPADELPIVGRELSGADPEYKWLLAHCDDGVTWGYRDASGWHLASASGLGPEPTRKNLQQLRLFGHTRELLLWRHGTDFHGRTLADASTESLETWAKPKPECRYLVGRKIAGDQKDGFSVLGDDFGSRHAVPIVCTEDDFKKSRYPLRLELKHYFHREEETGVVRIAASRLVRLWNAAREEKR